MIIEKAHLNSSTEIYAVVCHLNANLHLLVTFPLAYEHHAGHHRVIDAYEKKTFIFASAKPEKSKNFHWTYIWIFPNSFCTSSSSKTSSSPASFSSSSKFCSFSSSLPHSDSDNSASFSKNSAAFCFVIISSSEL